MKVQLETQPVLSQPEVSGWCRTLVLSASPQQIDPDTQPVWLISLASDSPAATTAGMSLLESLASTYHSLELKTAEALFQTLNQHTATLSQLSVAAACLTATSATLIVRDHSEVILLRHGQAATLVQSSGSAWQAVEGSWHPDDIWWLSAGRTDSLTGMTIPSGSDPHQFIEDLTIKYSQETQAPIAGLAFSIVEPAPLAPSIPVSPYVKKKRRVIALGLAVLALLIISVLVGAQARERRSLAARYQALEAEVSQTIAAATSLYPTDQIQARAQLKTLITNLDAQQSDFTPDSWAAKWQALSDQAHQAYNQISGEIVSADLPVWYPLNTIKADFKGNLLAQTGTDLVVWDQATATLVTIDINNKRNDIVAGGADLAGATALAVDTSRAVMVTSKGIVDISLTRNRVTTLVEPDSDWLSPNLIGLFNNNLYLVDSAAGNLWRYPAITGGVGAKQNWFGPGVSLSGTDYVKLAIDGQLWLLQSTGRLSRYTRGAPQSFDFTGLDQALGSHTPTFALHPEKDLLAIVDAANNRAVLATKAGVYQKQILWSGFTSVQDIAFSPNQDTLFILSQGNIYAANY